MEYQQPPHDSKRTTELINQSVDRLKKLQESIFDQMRKECGIRADLWESALRTNSVAGSEARQEERFKRIQEIADKLLGPGDNSVKPNQQPS